MKLAIITPVGPGHELCLPMCALSVIQLKHGLFDEIIHVIVNDTEGKWGRSRARNQGMEMDADWYFFLDADDVIMPYATRVVEKHHGAIFGAVQVNGRISPNNIWPCGLKDIWTHGAQGTLSMGFFVESSIARDLKFDESLNVGEDFDFYMRLPSFHKVKFPLVSINCRTPSAGGDKGYQDLDWIREAGKIVGKYEDFAR